MLPAEGMLQAQFLHHTEIVSIQLGDVVQAQDRPQCALAQEEFLGATHLCRDIRKSNSRRANWQRLFEPYDFFKGFKNYLQVWRPQKGGHPELTLPVLMIGHPYSSLLQEALCERKEETSTISGLS